LHFFLFFQFSFLLLLLQTLLLFCFLGFSTTSMNNLFLYLGDKLLILPSFLVFQSKCLVLHLKN
jgi:hypothetical protein